MITIEQITAILQKQLPKFWFTVENHMGMSSHWLAIHIAAKDHLINGVNGQRPQAVSLRLDTATLELKPQSFGGCGGQCIYRNIRPADPKEKYLAMKSVKIAFRTPDRNEAAVLRGIEGFCKKYKAALAENFSELRYHDIVDYDNLLN